MDEIWDGSERRKLRLREEAEARLAGVAPAGADRPIAELLRELQVHQIELEMQNESLRQAQVELEASRDRYADLYEFAPVGYLTLTREGLIAETNLTGAALLGVVRKQLPQHRFEHYVSPEDRERWRRLFISAMSNDARRHGELALRRGDGTRFQARLDCLRMAHTTDPPTLRMALADISELAWLQQTLGESEERYRLIFEKSNEAIFFGHPDGSVEAANPAACALFGYSEADIRRIGREGILDSSDPRLPAALETRRVTGAYQGELRCIRSDGSVFPAQVSSSVFRDSNGKESTSVLIRDISDQVRREAQVKHLNRVLRTISACNEDLVRARSEAELLGDICRDIVEIGDYQLAWVAVADPTLPGATTPIAWAGDEAAYRAHARLDHDPDHLRACLVSAALATLRSQICNRLNATPECTFGELSELGVQSVLSLPLLNEGRLYGALTIFSTKPDTFDKAEAALMEELAADLAYGISVLRMTQERDRYMKHFEQAMQSTVMAMARTLEMRDPYTAGHQQRVTGLALAIAEEMGLDERVIEGLKFGGMIHDIGKIGVPAEILAKPGKLTPIEFQLIQQHPKTGCQLVADIDFPWPMAKMLAQHHERLDGSGYPAGLKGDDILLEARILAVADVVEAMSAHRPYRAGLGMDAALGEIERGSGLQYDAAAVAACTKVVRENGMRLPA